MVLLVGAIILETGLHACRGPAVLLTVRAFLTPVVTVATPLLPRKGTSEQLSRAELRKPLPVTKGIFLKVKEDPSVTSLPAAQKSRRVRILSEIN